MTHAMTLKAAGFTDAELTAGTLSVTSPIDGAEVARVEETPRGRRTRRPCPPPACALRAGRTSPE
jgi:hypothetical protein